MIARGTYSVLIGIVLFGISCGRDRDEDVPDYAALALKEGLAEIHTCMLEKRVSNAVSLINHANFMFTSTNYHADRFRAAYVAVWINTNFNQWDAPSTDTMEKNHAAIVGKYDSNGQHCYAAIGFNGKVFKHDAPPSDGFGVYDLKRQP
jgi:hypothetical protein